MLKDPQEKVLMTDLGAVRKNGYAERLIEKIKEEEVNLTEYQVCWDAYHQIGTLLETVYL